MVVVFVVVEVWMTVVDWDLGVIADIDIMLTHGLAI